MLLTASKRMEEQKVFPKNQLSLNKIIKLNYNSATWEAYSYFDAN